MDAGPDVRAGKEKAPRREGERHTVDGQDHLSMPPMLIIAISQCKQMTGEEVLDLKSLARGLPSCVLKKVIAMKMLMDKKELRNITKYMKRGQLKAMLQRVSDECRLNAGIKDEHHITIHNTTLLHKS